MTDLVSIGVDMGGTKIEVAVLKRPGGAPLGSGKFDVLARNRVPTDRDRGYDAVLETMAGVIRKTAGDAAVDEREVPVGVGMPGSITRREGLVKNSNTVCLNGRPFRADLSRMVGRAIAFENDANCFALAEAVLGAARAHVEGIVFGVILGTGVGGGIVIGGKVWSGPQSIGGEWGHHAVGPWRRRKDAHIRIEERPAAGDTAWGLGERPVCYCGNTGCLELYASGVQVERDYERRSGQARKLAEIVSRRDADEHAGRAIDELLEAFGRGVANLIDILDPSAIVLGGGVSNLDLLYTEGRDRAAKYVFNDELLTPILKHDLGDSAGVFGAALLPAV
jgi:fructokinase